MKYLRNGESNVTPLDLTFSDMKMTLTTNFSPY
jgi:hypothetical protein